MDLTHPLMSLALTLVAGILGGELFARFKLPKVTGWIGTGIVVRSLGLPGLGPGDLNGFAPFTDFVLGYIAFTVGSAFHLASLRNAGKRLSLLVVTEALITPALVVAALIFIGGQSVGIGLVMAAVAIAGAPGTTVIVVQEARAHGTFVKTLVAAVALIDMVAVVGFAFVVSLLDSGGAGLDIASLTDAAAASVTKLGVALVIGAGCAGLALLIARLVNPSFLGPTMVATILGAWGLGQATDTSSILACSLAGVMLTNFRHETARAGDAYLKPFGGVLFAGFYTFAGMRLDFSLVVPLAGLVGLFFFARLVGKSISAYLAMTLARMTSKVRRYLGVALLPHGGVAVGLILLVEENAHLASMHDTVAAVGLAALAINQLVGPSATRFALQRAGEVGLDRPRLLDFLGEQHIVVDVKASSREELIRQLADRLYATGGLSVSKGDFVREVLAREEEASTCLGEGFMIPHTALAESDEVKGVLGLSCEGLDLGAPDGRRVHAAVLLATPETDRNRHLEILAAFASAITRNTNLREQLYSARSAAHAYDILHADDAVDFNYFLDEQMAPSRAGHA